MGCNSGHNSGKPTQGWYDDIAKLKALEPRYNELVSKIKNAGIKIPSEIGGTKYQNIFCTGNSPEQLLGSIEKWEQKLIYPHTK